MFRIERESPRQRAADYYATPPRLRQSLLSYNSATGRVLLRIHKNLHVTLKDMLEREGAPFHVWRFVAWAEGLADQQVRFDLMMHLRQERAANDPNLWAGDWKWLADHEKSAALRLFDELRASARNRRTMPPKPAEIPAETYRVHIAKAHREVGRRKRAVNQQHSSEPALTEPEIKTLETILEKARRRARRFA